MSVGREGVSGGQSGRPSSELRGVAGALVDQTLVGLICLDHRGVIVESNARAREVFGADGGLRERNGRLGTHRPNDAAVFERLLQAALDGSAVPGVGTSAVLGAWPGQRPLTVHVNSVPLAPDGGLSVAVLVTIVDPWVRIPVDPGTGWHVSGPDTRGERCRGIAGRGKNGERDCRSYGPVSPDDSLVGQAGTGQDLVSQAGRSGPVGALDLPVAGSPACAAGVRAGSTEARRERRWA